jgi:hypothetical protein
LVKIGNVKNNYIDLEGFDMSEKKKRDKTKSTLSSSQEVAYARDFKMADQAGGYTPKKARH